MSYDHPLPDGAFAANFLHTTFLAFLIACFTLTVMTDIVYWRTQNLLWLHFSEWLLLAGLVFGILAGLVRLVDYLVRRIRPSWLAVIDGIVVLLLAALNKFHTHGGRLDSRRALQPDGITADRTGDDRHGMVRPDGGASCLEYCQPQR